MLAENCSLRGIKVARIKPGMTPHEKELIEVRKEIKILEKSGQIEAVSQSDMFKNMVSSKNHSGKNGMKKDDDKSVVTLDSRSTEGKIQKAMQAREKRYST